MKSTQENLERFRIAGVEHRLSAERVEDAVAALQPEPPRDHFAVIGGRRYPPKQVLARVTGPRSR